MRRCQALGICSYRFAVSLSLLIMSLALATLIAPSASAEQPDKLRIGLSGRIMREVSDAQAKEALNSLQQLVKNQTGHANELIVEPEVDKLAAGLAEKKLDFAILLGFEFAWARQKNPKALPLAIAISGDDPHLRAHVMARQDSAFSNLLQLQGKPFGVPPDSRPHCRLFVDRQCKTRGKSPQEFFSPLIAPATLEDALDDVVDGAVQGVIMDDIGLEAYKRRKPGRFVKLKEIQTSEVFPAPVIAYQPGTLDEPTLKRFRDDLIKSNQDAEAQRLLTLWKLYGFAHVPDDYDKTVSGIIKAYPPDPGAKGK